MSVTDSDTLSTYRPDVEGVLRILCQNSEQTLSPSGIATEFDQSISSVRGALLQLESEGLVKKESGRYFVNQRRLAEIQGVVGDSHNLRQMARETGQTPVHPEETVSTDNQPDQS